MAKFDKIIFDFDDTIWARDDEHFETSVNNLQFVADILQDRAIIVSGSPFFVLKEKFEEAVVNVPLVVADANSTIYKDGKFVETFPECDIYDEAYIIKEYLKDKMSLESSLIGTTCLKIRPIRPNSIREVIAKYLNEEVFPKLGIKKCVAKVTGKTTIDIVSIYNSKKLVYNKLELDKYRTLYIGDEIDSGNDKDIALLCDDCIRVRNVEDTANLFKIWE